ncbi:MAG: exopolysaccharide biosynthesis polyprenyl glycosylphosphotransferase [Devosia sp.]
MSTIDTPYKISEFASRRLNTQIVGRAPLILAIAAVEGSTAGVVVLGSAFAYHLWVLHFSVSEFAWPLYLLFCTLAGLLYGGFSAAGTARFLDKGRSEQRSTLPDAFYGWTAAIALTLLTAFLLGSIGDLSRVSLTSAYVAGVPLVLMLRSFGQSMLTDRISRGELHYQRVAVIGNRLDVMNFLLAGDLWRQGQRLTGTFYLEDATLPDGELDLDALRAFARTALRQQTESMVIVAALHDFNALEQLVTEMKRFALNVIYAPATTNRTLRFLDVVPIGANNALRFVRRPLSDFSVLLKRGFDLLLAGVGIVLLLPLFAVVALAIRLDTPGPVIYRQARRGFNGETFMIWKFRSMSVMESGHAMHQARPGDRRVTRVGRFIRKTSIDELPQLVNVLLGQMSLIGPRPHAISHDDQLSKVLATYAQRQRIKPGITGWAQVNGFRGETASAEQIEGRVTHDIYYIDNWSIYLDVWIVVRTAIAVLVQRDVY